MSEGTSERARVRESVSWGSVECPPISQARVRNFIVDLIVESCDLGFLMELVIKLNVALHYQQVIDDSSCDYECLLETSPPGMWGSLATYYIAVIADVIVYLGYLYDGCGDGS